MIIINRSANLTDYQYLKWKKPLFVTEVTGKVKTCQELDGLNANLVWA